MSSSRSDLRATPAFFRALPAYLGGKRRLAPLIFALIAEAVPRDQWADRRLLDPFSGGGAVALYAKAQGFQVVASDLAERAAVVTRALVQNDSCRLRHEDVLDLFRASDESVVRRAAPFSPSVFTAAQAAWMDRALVRADRRGEPWRSLLRLLIIKVALRSQPMSLLSGTDARAAAEGDFDRVSPRRLGHYLRAARVLRPEGVWRLAQDVNAGVFGGHGTALCADARRLIVSTDADIVYLDPPYAGTSRYGREYRVLDAVLGDGDLDVPPPTLDEILDAAQRIPVCVLSYGGPTLTLEQLTAVVRRHRVVRRAITVPYRHLESLATKEKNHGNREYLIVSESV